MRNRFIRFISPTSVASRVSALELALGRFEFFEQHFVFLDECFFVFLCELEYLVDVLLWAAICVCVCDF
jgi:hypothetical protein